MTSSRQLGAASSLQLHDRDHCRRGGGRGEASPGKLSCGLALASSRLRKSARRRDAIALLLLEPVLAELQGAAVLRHDPYDAIWESVRDSGVDLKGELDVRADQ